MALCDLKNTFVNSYRKDKKRNQTLKCEEELSSAALLPSSTGNKALNSFVMADIQAALSKLPESYRIPFVRYFEGYKYHEIAQEMGIPLGTVKTHIYHARIQLKKHLQIYNFERMNNVN
ncbi:RNA polymerase sigma factor [Pedobacter rhizosphaerae]|uniref:RNA polymerase sigma factor n=1 Tax=Pedobacter rhizosphaerae TaxID=390241 RepID=UPI0029372A76|nr:RNA polymerase sigma factor [Pedobacter rhizosphaerae]